MDGIEISFLIGFKRSAGDSPAWKSLQAGRLRYNFDPEHTTAFSVRQSVLDASAQG
jgi:hypothetical protein